MAWHAKVNGGYYLTSAEAKDNIFEINTWMNAKGYTLEAQAGMIGNMANEGGLNPWRWQIVGSSEPVIMTSGYGLFQYTPASGYINGAKDMPFYAPNTSKPVQSSTAEPYDGYCQLEVFATNLLGKWNTYWYSGWGYGANYQRWVALKQNYAAGGNITQDVFATVDNVSDASFIFLTHFERPTVLNPTIREQDANTVFPWLTTDTPQPPEPPSKKTKKMPIYFYLKPF